LLEIKGYEVFRVDRQLTAGARLLTTLESVIGVAPAGLFLNAVAQFARRR
jgi:hypothetical protein